MLFNENIKDAPCVNVFLSVANLGKKFDMRNVILKNLTCILFFALFFVETWGCKTTETYKWPNGDTYTGEWKGEIKHGYGTYIYANGNKYVGQYCDGVKHGYGSYHLGAFVFEGNWEHGKPNTDGTGEHAAYGHYLWGEEYNCKQQYRKALIEYNRALSKKNNKLIVFSCYNNMGIIYLHMGSEKEAARCFEKAAEIWPERGYYPYMGLSSLSHKQGKIEESLKYRQEAYNLVQGVEYEEIERIYSGYDKDTLKKWVTVFYESSQLQIAFDKLERQYLRKNFHGVKQIANEILQKKYHAGLGISVEGTFVISVNQEGIGALNGVVEGDQLLEIDGNTIYDPKSAITELANLHDRFGENVELKIMRKNRKISIDCHLYYPELEISKRKLEEVNKIISSGKAEELSKDIEPPMIVLLTPEIKRGIGVVSLREVDFVLMAGDNVEVASVVVNGKQCEVSEGTFVEKSLIQGNTQKYRTSIQVTKGNNIVTVKATDTSGNVKFKKIPITYSPSFSKESKAFYGNSIAVVIGIDNYTQWPSLEFAVNDAVAVSKKLRELGFHRIVEFYNADATKLQINRLLRDTLPKMLGKNDRILVYFAGHGQTETFRRRDNSGTILTEKEGYIIPIDADYGNFKGTAISMATIRESVKNYKAKHVLFVFDSCYSGLGLKRSGGMKKADNYIKKLLNMRAVQIITAGGEDEQVGEEKGHGIFTKHLLLALGGKADLDKDGFVTASEIGTYIRPTVSRQTKNMQTPKFGWISGEGDFIFEYQNSLPLEN